MTGSGDGDDVKKSDFQKSDILKRTEFTLKININFISKNDPVITYPEILLLNQLRSCRRSSLQIIMLVSKISGSYKYPDSK